MTLCPLCAASVLSPLIGGVPAVEYRDRLHRFIAHCRAGGDPMDGRGLADVEVAANMILFLACELNHMGKEAPR